MTKESLIRLSLVAMLAASLAFSGGCLDSLNDDGALPDEVAAALEAAEDDLAEGISSLATEIATGSLGKMIELSAGGGSPLREESVVWNAEEQAWIISDSEIFEDEEVSGESAYTYWVQFRIGEVPQQEPNDLTDRIEVRFEGTQSGNYHPGDFDVDFDLAAGTSMLATKNEDDSVDIDGTGEAHGTTELHLGDLTFRQEQNMSWEFDFLQALPDQACVSGVLAGVLNVAGGNTNRSFHFQGTFDGAGNLDWVVTTGDRTIVDETKSYDCDGSGGV